MARCYAPPPPSWAQQPLLHANLLGHCVYPHVYIFTEGVHLPKFSIFIHIVHPGHAIQQGQPRFRAFLESFHEVKRPGITCPLKGSTLDDIFHL